MTWALSIYLITLCVTGQALVKVRNVGSLVNFAVLDKNSFPLERQTQLTAGARLVTEPQRSLLLKPQQLRKVLFRCRCGTSLRRCGYPIRVRGGDCCCQRSVHAKSAIGMKCPSFIPDLQVGDRCGVEGEFLDPGISDRTIFFLQNLVGL